MGLWKSRKETGSIRNNEKMSGGTSGNDIVRAWGEKLLEQRRKRNAGQ